MKTQIKLLLCLSVLSFVFSIGCKKEETNCENENPPQNNQMLIVDKKYGNQPQYNSIVKLIPVEEGYYFLATRNKASGDESEYVFVRESGNAVGLMDKSGNIQWEKTLSMRIWDFYLNDGLVAIGNEAGNNIKSNELKFVTLDNSGAISKDTTIVFDETIGVFDHLSHPYFNGSMLFTGSYSNSPMLMLMNNKLELDTLISFSNYSGYLKTITPLHKILQVPSNFFVLGGNIYNNNMTSAFLVKVSKNIISPEVGICWTKEYEIDNKKTTLSSLSFNYDNNDLFICGTHSESENAALYNPFVIKTNNEGEVIWEQVYDISNKNDFFWDCYFDQENYILYTCGYHSSYAGDGDCGWLGNGLIAKIHENGDLINYYTFGNSSSDSEIICIIPDSDQIVFGGIANLEYGNGCQGWFGKIYR